ncbi:lysozyme [Pasteurellaceae bacterium USgator11]|nr:lysozyme [Pasteurellaceae bacterium USgator41]TNG96464.1 lysozyme [Pasteurellaceae bacterium UScroc12]TNH00454.1 lysozyme [Pasteurellaceae bacterium UScroc31]TNH01715.1 lysozyme [Pasteurellaceae bacterium USgator11]
MRFSENGIKMLIALEGEKLKAYLDSAGIWTIGVGHIGSVDGVKISRSTVITREKSRELLREDLKRFEICVNRYVHKVLTQFEYDALVIFVFNIGCSGFTTSTALTRLNRLEPPERVTEAMSWWNKATVKGQKVVIPGLNNRRKAEIDLYLRGRYVGVN